MAKISFTGADDFILSMEQVAQLPTEVQDEMLNAQADVVAAAQRKKVRTYGIYDPDSTKHVADSIKKGKVKTDKEGRRVIYVTPTGSRKRGDKRVRNAEILFVNEYGRRNQKARPAVRDANLTSAEATTEAGAAVFFKWQENNGL